MSIDPDQVPDIKSNHTDPLWLHLPVLRLSDIRVMPAKAGIILKRQLLQDPRLRGDDFNAGKWWAVMYRDVRYVGQSGAIVLRAIVSGVPKQHLPVLRLSDS